MYNSFLYNSSLYNSSPSSSLEIARAIVAIYAKVKSRYSGAELKLDPITAQMIREDMIGSIKSDYQESTIRLQYRGTGAKNVSMSGKAMKESMAGSVKSQYQDAKVKQNKIF